MLVDHVPDVVAPYLDGFAQLKQHRPTQLQIIGRQILHLLDPVYCGFTIHQDGHMIFA